MLRWQSPFGGESTGIHSPWRVCHCSTPPTPLNLMLRHTKLSPRASRASSSGACYWSVCLVLLVHPAYLVVYAIWD